MRQNTMRNSIQNENLKEIYKQRNCQLFKNEVCYGKKPFKIQRQVNLQLSENTTIKSQAMKNLLKFEEEKVFGNAEQQINVKDETEYPYCAIGLVHGKFGEKYYNGTGFLVSQRYVLTCAHNIYDRTEKKMCQNLLFTPGLNGVSKKAYRVMNFYFLQEFKTVKQSDQFDFSILELEVELGDTCGFMGIDTSAQNLSNEEIFEVTGYPGNKQKEEGEKVMWKACGKVENGYEGVYLIYKIPTTIGSSGSPLFKKKQFAVGIHTGNTLHNNIALRLTNSIRKNLNSWVSKLSGQIKLCNQEMDVVSLSNLANFSNDKIITFLNLSRTKIGQKMLALLAYGNWKHLKDLNLSQNKIADREMILIPRFFPHLEEFNISKNLITDIGVKYLAQGNLSYLQVLDLSYNKIGNLGINQLLNFTSLMILKLENTEITKDGVANLAKGKFPYLQSLTLNDNKIEDDICMKFLQNFIGIEELNLERIGITSNGLEQLCKGQFKYLYSIKLSGNNVGDEGIKFLGKFKTLRYVNLSDTGITGKELKIFLHMGSLKFEALEIEGNKLSEQGRQIIEQLKLQMN